MADNTYRTSRRDTAAPGGQQLDDPLAELARLIGQNPPANATAERPAQHHEAPPLDVREGDQQWPADARHAEQYPEQYDERQGQYGDRQSQYGDSQYGDSQTDDSQYNESHDAPRVGDPYPPPYRAAPPSYNADYEQPEQSAAPAEQYDSRGYTDQPRYDDEHDPIQDLPAFLPRLRQETTQGRTQVRAQGYAENFGQDSEDSYSQGNSGQVDYGQRDAQDRGYAQDQSYAQDQGQQAYGQRYAQEGDADDQAYALEDYEEEDEAPAPKRRGLAIAAALLGVLVLGAGGAFGYHAMFGGSIVPSLPPIIKADGTPNKIVPAGSASSSGQASASNSGDKLVSREEKPVDVPAAANTPRVVSTIPVFPDPNAGMPTSVVPGSPSMAGQNMTGQNLAGQNMAGQNLPGAVVNGLAGAPGGAMSPLGPTAAPVYGGAGVAPAPGGLPLGAAPQAGTMPTQPPVAGTTNSKKIHTVAIHTGAQDNADNSAAAAPPQAQAAPAPAPPRAAQTARPVPPRPVPSAPQGGGPMSIVPSQDGGDTTPQTRTALARPSAPVAERAPSSGGIFVQVSSQRSEAEAQSAYRDMQGRFPSQLGGHAPTVRQVNLGEKGTFYRTLVGPFASTEQAAQMCSSLKAAGGNCIVQRN